MSHEATGTQPKAGDEAADTTELHGIRFDTEDVIQLLRRFHVARIRAYGSVLRADFSPDSDLDLLVEFESGHDPGWEIFDLEFDIGALLGRKVDLSEPNGLSKYIKERVLSEARTVYVH